LEVLSACEVKKSAGCSRPCIATKFQAHTVVEDKVDARQLLQPLEQASSEESLAYRSLEAVEIRRLAKAHLIAMIGFDLAELLDQCWIFRRETSETTQ
jgi:hypothetical protein